VSDRLKNRNPILIGVKLQELAASKTLLVTNRINDSPESDENNVFKNQKIRTIATEDERAQKHAP
jgi:hypothetical protein